MKGSRRLVIDASVAGAAGGAEAAHPTSKSCRDFLQAILNICHRAVFPPQLTEEWKRKASLFAHTRSQWFCSILSREAAGTPVVGLVGCNSHTGSVYQRWQVAMERRQKIDWTEAATDDELRQMIAEAAASKKDKAAMEKDAFLLEAAEATKDRMVASLDESARGLFRELSGKFPRIGKVVWVNPGSEKDSALEWWRSGAKPESHRKLGYRRKREK